MRTTFTLSSLFFALLSLTHAQDDPYYGSVTGYSGVAANNICEGDVLGVAVALDGSSSDCVSAPANCLRGSTTAGAGVFSGDCAISVWSSAGCPGDADFFQPVGYEGVYGASNVQSFKISCQMT